MSFLLPIKIATRPHGGIPSSSDTSFPSFSNLFSGFAVVVMISSVPKNNKLELTFRKKKIIIVYNALTHIINRIYFLKLYINEILILQI